MTAGVSINSRSAAALFALGLGAADVNYPVTNLSDLWRISKVFRATPTGNAVVVGCALDASRMVDFVALVNHTIPAGAHLRIRFYSDPNPFQVDETYLTYDSGVIAFWGFGGAPVAGYQPTRPFWLNDEPRQARAVRIDLGNLPGPIEIGGIEIGELWHWDGIPDGQDLGFDNRVSAIAYAGGGGRAPASWEPRIFNAELLLPMKEAVTTGLDFHTERGRSKPFVFVENLEDPKTWARRCFLATNAEVPPSVGRMYRHDGFSLRFVEHAK